MGKSLNPGLGLVLDEGGLGGFGDSEDRPKENYPSPSGKEPDYSGISLIVLLLMAAIILCIAANLQ
jgi:hypothetical protein